MKKFKLFILSIISILLLSGCDFFKIDTMEGIDIITTSYPLEFIISFLQFFTIIFLLLLFLQPNKTLVLL